MKRMSASAPNRAWKRAFSLFVVMIALAGVFYSFRVAIAQAPTLVISQVYGGGGNGGATYTHDFIEIFNNGSTSVSLNGLSVQYASPTGTGNFGANANQITVLPNVSLQPGQYYLIQQASQAAVGIALPTPDLAVPSGSAMAMGAGGGKVIIANTTTTLGCNGSSSACNATQLGLIIDLVGYGNANFFEGSVAAPTPSATLSVIRSDADGGCTDTNQNGNDFTAVAVNLRPRNTATTLNPCGTVTPTAPSVVSSSPASGETGVALDANIVVTFDKAVKLTGEWFSIVCSNDSIDRSIAGGTVVSGGPITWGLNPIADFTLADTCSFTVFGSQVATQGEPTLVMESDYIIQFDLINTDPCSDAYTPIFDIQGTGANAAITGVVTTKGIVTASYEGAQPALRGYYLQDPTGDGNPETSDGIFVFTNGNTTVNEGDLVVVTGSAGENQGQTQLSSVTSTSICGTGNTVESTSVNFPVAPPSGGVDYLERFEGMLVDLPQTLYVTEMFQLGRFGQVVVSVNGRQWQPTHVYDPGSPEAIALAASNLLERIILDDATNDQNRDPLLFGRGGNPLSASNTLRGGDTVVGYEGIMTYTWAGNAASGNAWRVRPIGSAYPNFQATNPRPAPIVRTTDLRVTALNLLNFFNTFNHPGVTQEPARHNCYGGVGGALMDCRGASDTAEFNRQIVKTVEALLGTDADVIAISEIENDGHEADSAIQRLVDELNAAVGVPGTWAFINPDATLPLNSLGTDAIKNGILYKPSMVTPVGATAVLNTVAFVNGGDSSPRNRPALAQSFEEIATGANFTIVSNHLKSKGSACTAPDAGDGQGNCNIVRTNAANELTAWLATYPTGIVDSDVLIVGDLNSYAMEDPIMAIKNAGYTDLAFVEAGSVAYSYVFDGAWGYLDYSLASNSLASQVAHATTWHINSDEPNVLDYLFDFKSASQQTLFFAPDEFRTSDHDPVLVDLDLTPITHTLTTNTVGNGTLARNPDQPFFDHRTVVTVTAIPDAGWHLAQWEGACTGSGACVVTMDSAKELTATFSNTHTVEIIIPNPHGTVTLDPPGGVYTHGTTVIATRTPDTGYRLASTNFQGITSCTYVSEIACQFVVTQNVTVTANFEVQTFQLVITKQGSGTGTTSYPSEYPFATFDYGTVVTPTATADVSSHFTGWTGACTGTGPCVLTMNEIKYLWANFAINQYALTTTTDGTGSGSVTQDPATGPYSHGTTVTVTPTASSDSDFVGWAGACTGSGACEVTMDAAKTVTATFDLKNYALTVNKVGSGTTSVASGTEFAHGTAVTVTATQDTGWHFIGWTGDCSGTGDCVVTMDGAKTVTATFEINSYTITPDIVGNGSLVTDPAGPNFTHGTVVTVTAVADTGWYFSGWSSADCFTHPCVLVMDSNKTLVAVFDTLSHVLTTATDGTGNGSVSTTPGTGPFDHGTVVAVNATADPGSTFAGWSGACSGLGACSVTMDAAKSVTATFDLNLYAILTNLLGSGSGSFTIDPPSGPYTHGMLVTLTALANPGSRFAGWSGDCSGAGMGACSFTITGNKNIGAIFELEDNDLTIAMAGTGTGTVTTDPSGDSFAPGTVVTATAVADAGSVFAGWSGDCSGETCVLTMDSAKSITATFDLEAPVTPITHTLSVALAGNGSGLVTSDPTGIDCGEVCSLVVDEGTVVTLSVSISAGTLFAGWEGTGCGDAPICAITMTASTQVTATFDLESYEVALEEIEGGTIDVRVVGDDAHSAGDVTSFPYGTVLEFTAVPDEGYLFTGWTGDLSGTETPTQIVVTGELLVGAVFNLMGDPEFPIFLPVVTSAGEGEE